MQQYYTLEEAAQKLGMTVDELRELAKSKKIRAFQDRGNWRFRSQDIDERARQLGLGSEPELQLGDPKGTAKMAAPKTPKPRPRPDFTTGSEEDLDLGTLPPKGSGGPASSKSLGGPSSSKNLPKSGSDSDVRLVMDDIPELKLDSDVKLHSPSPRPVKRGGDSGVRLDKLDPGSDSDVKLVEDAKPASDSDIRLQDLPAPTKKGGKGDANIITEEIDLDAEEARLAKQPPPAPSKPTARPRVPTQVNPELPVLPTSSPYELSESDMGLDLPPTRKGPKTGKTTNDSSSEHELIAFDAAKARGGDLGSGEIPLLEDDGDLDLGALPPPGPGNSGINLDDPVDSGISLESGGSDELEFELSLDAGSTPKPEGKKPLKEDSSSEFELSIDDAPSDASDSEFELSLDEDSAPGGADLALEKVDNSDSEFELTLDEDGGLGVGGDKDIFETNLDLPSLEDSGSEAVALEGSDSDLEATSDSDFELSMDDDSSAEKSGSQVVAIDGEEADDVEATVAKPRGAAAKAPPPKTKAKAKPAKVDEDEVETDFGGLDDEDEPAPKAKKGAAKKKPAPEDEVDEDDEEVAPAAAAPPADWGPLPAVLLFPTVIVLFFVGLMGYELIQGMWGYHRSTKVGRPIIDSVARMIDDTIPKE